MSPPGFQSARLYVGGIPQTAQPKEVEDLFSKYGKIHEVRLNRNFAFVQFSNDQEAQAAIKELNGTQHFGRRLDVQMARAPKGPGGGGGGGPKGDDGPNRDGRDRSPIGNRGGPGMGGGRGGGGAGGGGRGGGGFRGSGPFNSGGGRGGPGGPPPFGGQDLDQGGSYGGGGPPRLGGGGGGGPPPDFRGGGDFGGGGPRHDGGGPSPFGRPEPGGGGGGSLFGPGGGRDFSLAPPSGFRGNDNRPDDYDRKPWGGGGGGGGFGLNEKAFDSRPGMRGGGGGDLMGGGGGGGGYPPLQDRGNVPFPGGGGGLQDRGNSGPYPPPSSQQDRPPTHKAEPLAVANSERTNDIEIIIVDKALTDYGEMVERKLCGLGFSVDVLFPHEAVPLARVLGNIASRGTLYAVVITHVHQINGSLTLHILHGRPQEHRNMAVDDAITLLLRNYEAYTRACREKGEPNTPPEQVRHLLTQVLNGRPLNGTQYDILVQYILQEKLKSEPQATLGGRDNAQASAQAELQTRILSILNKAPVNNEVQQQVPLQQPGPLLQDPSIQKALDSLIQGGDLLRKIAPQQPPNPFNRY